MPSVDDIHIHVDLVQRSGSRHVFEITEDILGQLENARPGAHPTGADWIAWLGFPATDPPASVHVSGRRRDGRDVSLELRCDSD